MTNSSNLIDSLEVYILNNPDEVKPYWVSHFIVPTANELLIKIKTKDGHSGFGLATSYTDIAPIIKPCLLYTSPSPRDDISSRMPSSA